MKALRGYQTDLLNKAIASFKDGKREVVLAACPGAGKTLMSIMLFARMLKEGLVGRGLVLAHGTTLLRSQYAAALAELDLPFDWVLYEGREDEAKAQSAQLVIAIPQSWRNTKPKLGHFDIVIVDEAHEHYAAKTVQSIIAPIKRVLCLTGTPASFVAKGATIHGISLGELYKEKEIVVSDVMVELMDSERRFNYETDYNASYDLREDFNFHVEDTNDALDKLLDSVQRRLRLTPGNSVVTTMQFDAIQSGRISAWEGMLRELKKTMFACRSVEQARQVRDYFERHGIHAALSTGKDDPHNEVIERDFKGNPDCPALIVVQRGVLGFDFPGLANVVDMTGSWNIDRIYQLLCRVVRVDPTNRQKLFVKVSSIDPQLARAHMSLALQLMDADWFLTWDGKASTKLNRKIVDFTALSTREASDKKEPSARKTPSLDAGMLLFGDFFKDILHRDGAHDVYARTTLGDVEKSLGVRIFTHDPSSKQKIMKLIVEYCEEHGRWMPHRHPLSSRGHEYRQTDPDFKKQTDLYMSRQGVVKYKGEILTLIAKTGQYIKQGESKVLYNAASKLRQVDPDFKKQTDPYMLKKDPATVKEEALKYCLENGRYYNTKDPRYKLSAQYRLKDPDFKKQTDPYMRYTFDRKQPSPSGRRPGRPRKSLNLEVE